MGFYPELWSGQTLNALVRALKTTQRIVNSIVDYTPKTIGKKASGYNGPKLGALTAVDLPADPGDVNERSKTNIQIAFDQKKGVPFRINSIEDAQQAINEYAEDIEDAKDALLDAYDLFIITQLILNLNSSNRKTLADDTNNKLTKADFLAARKGLNAAKVPLKARYCAICPEHEEDLYEIDGFVSRDKIPDTAALKDGVIGRLLGFDIILYNDMPLVDSNGILTGTKDKNVTLFYSKLAYGFGRQKEFETKATTEPLTPADLVNIWSVYGGKIQYDTYAYSYRDNVIA